MRDRVFYSICFGFIFGVLLRSFVLVNFYLVILFGIISFALLLFFILISKNKWGVIAGVFILAFCLGISRFSMADISAPSIFEENVGKKVSLAGEIMDEPNIGEKNQKLIAQIKTKEGETKVLIYSNIETNYQYGDEIEFNGILEKPENFTTDQG